MSTLSEKHCVSCEGGVEPLSTTDIATLMPQIGDGWSIVDAKLTREFKFKTFKDSIAFVNNVADIAEREGHHPDISISFNKVKLVLFTHAIGGLSTNDFVLAAKISRI